MNPWSFDGCCFARLSVVAEELPAYFSIKASSFFCVAAFNLLLFLISCIAAIAFSGHFTNRNSAFSITFPPDCVAYNTATSFIYVSAVHKLSKSHLFVLVRILHPFSIAGVNPTNSVSACRLYLKVFSPIILIVAGKTILFSPLHL